jgi:hypothetical protein
MDTKEVWKEGENTIKRSFNQQLPPKIMVLHSAKHKTTDSMQQRNHIKNIYLRNAVKDRP